MLLQVTGVNTEPAAAVGVEIVRCCIVFHVLGIVGLGCHFKELDGRPSVEACVQLSSSSQNVVIAVNRSGFVSDDQAFPQGLQVTSGQKEHKCTGNSIKKTPFWV